MKTIWTITKTDRETNNTEVIKTFRDKPKQEKILNIIETHSAIDLSKNKKETKDILEGTIENGTRYTLFSDVYTIHEIKLM